ncbi:hypothetical protein VOLCADRAFT_92717 [Volvox carteri f. nagariensis]|uniref:RING-type domain-containing protein n=1 Tax=Volvox carteri f. nagariensis TaxID=3068 RepID=D8U0C4_VOLCA|nr:uncharacterized protein VOLCADRAFT_92717 [Volvox carteri f. nagariensis]EFJ46917.1 hypothetical protein VOLCADRAFT_92717 [Volvox carteri f. nagariensis]|eukprot:XP_002952126.1 hypothetical protein VOLCADRAFT_92717 [Volvox carteri f. nagariensis]
MHGQRVAYESTHQATFCNPYNIGVNAIFLVLIPYTLVTALHDTHLEVSLILGTAFSGANLLIGIIARIAGGYRTWPYALELFMLAVNAVLLGVSYPAPDNVTKYLPFIANSFYAAFSLASIILTTPFTLQYAREFVPASAAMHDRLVRAAYVTAAVWSLTFVTNTLVFLVPICRGRDADHGDVLNLVFRIILPTFLGLFAALFTRLWPLRVMRHLAKSVGFDGAYQKVLVNPLALMGVGMPPPPPPPLPPPAPGPYSGVTQRRSPKGYKCTICLERMEADLATTTCGHMFCFKCISSWVQKSGNCPQCRSKLTRTKIIRIYPPSCDYVIDSGAATGAGVALLLLLLPAESLSTYLFVYLANRMNAGAGGLRDAAHLARAPEGNQRIPGHRPPPNIEPEPEPEADDTSWKGTRSCQEHCGGGGGARCSGAAEGGA